MVLQETKKLLGFDEDYKAFDTDLVIFINTNLAVLKQIGVHVLKNVELTDEDTWEDILGFDSPIDLIKSYIFLKVKLVFDPPNNGSVLENMKEQIKEYEWRINLELEVPSDSVWSDING